MVNSEQENNGSFCLHIADRWSFTAKILFFLSLKFQSENKYEFAYQNSCLNRNCIYFYDSIYLKRKFFADLSANLANSNSSIYYAGFKKFKWLLWPKTKTIEPPIWSPERFLQINYLGPVLVLRKDLESKKLDLNYESLVELLLSSSVEKLKNPSGLLLGKSKKNKRENHLFAVKKYLSKTRPLVGIEKSGHECLKLNYESMAPRFISIIIPTRGTKINGRTAVVELITSLEKQNFNKSKVEIVVVYDTDSELDYLDQIKSSLENIQIKKIAYTPPFNFSKKCNLGAANSSGEVIIFLNDDTKAITSNAILSLAGLATLPKIGAVGAKLFFENKTIQHAGIFVMGGNVGHAYFKQKNPNGPFGDLVAAHEVTGVTGACLAQRREIWSESGGWSEEFANSYNDVQYCFRLRNQGFSIIQNNSVELFHFESLTRDSTFSIEAKMKLEKKWNKYLVDDFYFPEYVKSQLNKRYFKRILKRVARKFNFR